ncbi:DUF805 domain-containing protein [Anaerovibrio sp.]|uniref:DUF805 domain-containing protein n=1 Tax=Anaerovibrio sp. TaxID=1872532 RepID=UPI003F178040
MLRMMFEGRMSRGRYLKKYFLVVGAAILVLVIVNAAFLAIFGNGALEQETMEAVLIAFVAIITRLITLSFDVRRLHDLGKGGVWLLLPVVQVAGCIATLKIQDAWITNLIYAYGIVLFAALAIIKGQQGVNEYGPACE